jgi:hypothetical protein
MKRVVLAPTGNAIRNDESAGIPGPTASPAIRDMNRFECQYHKGSDPWTLGDPQMRPRVSLAVTLCGLLLILFTTLPYGRPSKETSIENALRFFVLGWGKSDEFDA